MWALHGGGYTMGSAKGYRAYAAEVSRVTKERVFVPEYRLARDHPFSAAIKAQPVNTEGTTMALDFTNSEALAAIEEIKQLKARYCYCVDHEEWDQWI